MPSVRNEDDARGAPDLCKSRSTKAWWEVLRRGRATLGAPAGKRYISLENRFRLCVSRNGVEMATIHLAVNGRSCAVDAEPQASLLAVLREQLDLTGSKYGCGEGQCGACTVLVDGKAQRSCITRVGTVVEKQITTIEGLARGDQLHPVQQAFLDAGALQCGYCTSGMIMSAVALLRRNASPTEQNIVDFMDGNICRCGTYPRIVNAIQKAGKVMAGAGVGKAAGR